jgi:dipeptidyl aminopeptidase/acylaminoacyl peptidase
MKNRAAALLIAASPIVHVCEASAQTGVGGLSTAEAAKAFGARDMVVDTALSPSGRQVSVVLPGPGTSTMVSVVDLTSGKSEVIGYANGDPLSLSGCGWVSETRLLCSYYGISAMEGQRLGYSRLVAMDNKGNNIVPLGAREQSQDYVQQSDGYVIDWLDGSTNKVVMARRYVPAKANATRIGSLYDGLGVDMIDTTTGKVEHLETADPIAKFYLSDGRGHVRIKGVDTSLNLGYLTTGKTTYSYSPAGSNAWKSFSIYNGITGEGMYPVAVDGASNAAYALKKTNGRDALYRVVLDDSLKTDVVYAHPTLDVDGAVRAGRQGRVVGASIVGEKRETIYFDPKYKKIADGLTKKIPQLPLIQIVDSSSDETKHLVYAASDVDPGAYFLYEPSTGSLKLLMESRPQLHDVQLGVVKPVTYKAADGTSVPAYLTLPPGSAGKNLPAIVMPHGGPAARDEWGFDWLAQYFVNRGFAVLQPNFRGSTGYGDDWFKDNGFKSWKTAIGDVADAGRWLVKEGIADPAKLAIVGWSYGGYAALQSNVVDPDLFKAVVAIAPVTDLGMLKTEQRGFVNMNVAQDYIGDGAHIEEGSPARHASSFKAPVMMFHGDIDLNVDVKESRQMDSQLRRAGKRSELVVYKKLDHQLEDSAVRADMLSKADAFLRAVLKL